MGTLACPHIWFGRVCDVQSKTTNEVANIFFAVTGALLDAADNFVFLAFFEKKVVVCQLSILLLQATFDLVPGTFDGELGHGSRG